MTYKPKPWEADIPQSKSFDNMSEFLRSSIRTMNDEIDARVEEQYFVVPIRFDIYVAASHAQRYGRNLVSTLASKQAKWCCANCESSWKVADPKPLKHGGEFYLEFVFKFTNPRDATLFKLFWGGSE